MAYVFKVESVGRVLFIENISDNKKWIQLYRRLNLKLNITILNYRDLESQLFYVLVRLQQRFWS